MSIFKKKTSLSVLAIVLVFTLFLFSVFTASVSSAAAEGNNSFDFSVFQDPEAIFLNKNNVIGAYSSIENLKVTDLKAGGINCSAVAASVSQYQSVGYGTNVNLDGLFLVFDNLQELSGSANPYASRFSIVFGEKREGDLPPRTVNTNNLTIELDPANGRLGLVTGLSPINAANQSQVIVLCESELLKYANVAGKKITFLFSAESNGDYNLKLTVGDNLFDCVIPTEKIASSDTNTESCYVALTWNRVQQNSSIDFVSVAEGYEKATVEDTMAAIDVLSDGFSKEAADYALAKYLRLSENDKFLITNTDMLFNALQTKIYLDNLKDPEYIVMRLNKLAKYPFDLDYAKSEFPMTVTALKNGGVNFSFNAENHPGCRDGYGSKLKLDGLTLYFDNFGTTNNNSYNSRFMVDFGNINSAGYSPNNIEEANLGIYLDPIAGTIGTVNKFSGTNPASAQSIIITDSTLSYDNILGKSISYHFDKNIDGSYNFEANIGGKMLSAVIPKSTMDAATELDPDNCYMSVMSGYAWSHIKIDFLGISNGRAATADSVKAKIDSIGDVFIDSGKLLREILSDYFTLREAEREKVSNIVNLVSSVKEYEELKQEEDKDLIMINTQNASLLSSDNPSVQASVSSWKRFMNLTDDSGALKFEFSRSFKDVRDGYLIGRALDGLMVQLDNLSRNDLHSGSIALYIGTLTSAYGFDSSNSPLIISFDVNNGQIKLQPDDTVIIENDNLKYENISGKRFSVQFLKKDNGDYLLQVFVGTKLLAGTISKGSIDNAVGLNTSEAMVMLSTWASEQSPETYNVELIGIGGAYSIGDANGDSNVNILDLLRMKKYALGINCSIKGSGADITRDGAINSLDLSELKKIIMNMPTWSN